MCRNRTSVPRFGFQRQDLASDRIFAEHRRKSVYGSAAREQPVREVYELGPQ